MALFKPLHTHEASHAASPSLPLPQPRVSAAAQRELFFNYATVNATALYPTDTNTTSSNSTTTPVGYVLSSDATLNTQLGNSEGQRPVPGNEILTALLVNLTVFTSGRVGNNRWVSKGELTWPMNRCTQGMQLGKGQVQRPCRYDDWRVAQLRTLYVRCAFPLHHADLDVVLFRPVFDTSPPLHCPLADQLRVRHGGLRV